MTPYLLALSTLPPYQWSRTSSCPLAPTRSRSTFLRRVEMTAQRFGSSPPQSLLRAAMFVWRGGVTGRGRRRSPPGAPRPQVVGRAAPRAFPFCNPAPRRKFRWRIARPGRADRGAGCG